MGKQMEKSIVVIYLLTKAKYLRCTWRFWANNITNNAREAEFWCYPRSEPIIIIFDRLHSISSLASVGRGWVSTGRRFCHGVVGVSSYSSLAITL